MLTTSKLYSSFDTNFTFGAVYMGSQVWHAFRVDPRLTKNFVSVLSGYQLGLYLGVPVYTDLLVMEDQSFLEPEALIFSSKSIANLENLKSLPDFIQALHDQNLQFDVVKMPQFVLDEEKISDWSRNLLSILEHHGEVIIKSNSSGYKLTIDCFEREDPSLHILLAEAFSEL